MHRSSREVEQEDTSNWFRLVSCRYAGFGLEHVDDCSFAILLVNLFVRYEAVREKSVF